MTLKTLEVVNVLLRTWILLTSITNSVHCTDSEFNNGVEEENTSLNEKHTQQARYVGILDTRSILTTLSNFTDRFTSANVNGHYDSLFYDLKYEDLTHLPSFNTTGATVVALLAHFALIFLGLLKLITTFFTLRIIRVTQYEI